MPEPDEADSPAMAAADLRVPAWLPGLFARKDVGKSKVCSAIGSRFAPNIADVDNVASLKISDHIFEALHIGKIVQGKSSKIKEESLGKALEAAVEANLAEDLSHLKPSINWNVQRNSKISDFSQYSHLDELQKILAGNSDLRATFGGDYLVRPDVTIAVLGRRGLILHGVVSCKWTIRSDRAQNIRHEFNLLIKSRRGRTPHLVAVTAEPLPSRIISLTRGTGEIDVVYHVAYGLMADAVSEHGNIRHKRTEPTQREYWNEMVDTGRIRDYRELAADIALD